MSPETIQYIPIEAIECNQQVREQFSEHALVGLARSIQEAGLLQPVRLQPNGPGFVVVDGERRLRAVRLIKWTTIPAIIEDKPLSAGEMIHRQLIANLQRVDLTPCERARGIKRLIEETGWAIGEAAAKCGMSGSMASKLLAILELPAALQTQVDSGEIALSAAYELAGVSDPQAQDELAKRLSTGQLTRDGLVHALRNERRQTPESQGEKRKRVTAVLADGQSLTVAGALTLEGFVCIVETVLAKARRARSRGVEFKQFLRSLRDEAKTAASEPEGGDPHVAL